MGVFCRVSETKSGKQRHYYTTCKTIYKSSQIREKKEKKTGNKIVIIHIFTLHKSTSIMQGIAKTCLERWKRTKRGKETGTRHMKAAQTQQWTQDRDYDPGDPGTDTGTVWAGLQSHAGRSVICFLQKVQVTAKRPNWNLFIPASLTHVNNHT